MRDNTRAPGRIGIIVAGIAGAAMAATTLISAMGLGGIGPSSSSEVASAPASAPAKAWTAGIAWKAPDGADDAIKGCKDWACLFGVLQRYAAPAETIEFLKAEQQIAPTDDLGYPIAYHGSGKVKAVEIFDPGLGMEGTSEFVFVNGPESIVRPKVNIDQAMNASPEFQRFKSMYPQVTPWDGLAYQNETALSDGSQQFQFTQTLLNGCHACAVLGSLKLGFNFDNGGHFTGISLLGVTPEKDATYGAVADELAQKSQFFQTMNLLEPDGSTVSAQAQTIISAKSRCQFSVNTNPTMTSGWFMIDETFNVRDVQVHRTAPAAGELQQPGPTPSNALTISCNNSTACISPVFSDQRGAQAAVSAVTLLVPQENLDAVVLDFQRLQTVCGPN